MNEKELLRAAARCWERAGHYERAAERWAAADAWSEAGRCLAKAGRHVDAAEAYGRAGDHVLEARQWLESPWPESARRVYHRVLAAGASGASEVEALLGLGETGGALERSSDSSADGLRAMARMAAARGRPDLAARACAQSISLGPESARELHRVCERSAPWNASLPWERSMYAPPKAGWPTFEFGTANLKAIWESTIRESAMGGLRALDWSKDSVWFAAALRSYGIVFGKIDRDSVQFMRRDPVRISDCVAFVPSAHAVLLERRRGDVCVMRSDGSHEPLEKAKMPDNIWSISFSPKGDCVAISSYTGTGALLRRWRWHNKGLGEMVDEIRESKGNCHPLCAWSPDNLKLAWSPGPDGANRIVLLTSNETREVENAHQEKIWSISFSPNGRFLISSSSDQTVVVRDSDSGQPLAPPQRFVGEVYGASLHPQAALLAVGEGPRLHLLRLHVDDPPRLTRLSEHPMNEKVKSLAFSPDGRHLLVMTHKHLHLFRVHLTP